MKDYILIFYMFYREGLEYGYTHTCRPGRCPEIAEILKFVLKCPEIGVRS